MPPKRKAAAATTAGTVPKRASARARRPPTRPGDGTPVPPDPAPPQDPTGLYDLFSDTLNRFQEEQRQQLDDYDVTLQGNIQRMNEMATTLGAISQHLGIGVRPPPPPPPGAVAGIPPAVPGMSPAPPTRPQLDVLSQWPWVERSLVEEIANGAFDIYDLPKLHKDEAFRNRYIQKSMEGVMHPMTGGRPLIV